MTTQGSLMGDSSIRPMEILLVEDGWIDARVTIYAVRRSQVHHRITLVRSVSEAKRFLSHQGVFARAPRPDLILLDMMLPDGTGIDVMEAVKALDLPSDANPITTVVLTASDDENLRDQCRNLCIADFMNKPVREKDFMRVVRDHKRLMIHGTPSLASG